MLSDMYFKLLTCGTNIVGYVVHLELENSQRVQTLDSMSYFIFLRCRTARYKESTHVHPAGNVKDIENKLLIRRSAF